MQDKNAFLTPMDLVDMLGGISVQSVYSLLKSLDIDVVVTESRRKKIKSLGIRKLLIERGFKYVSKNISFQIVKGGVGKTSLSYALGLRASHYGAKVLLVDLDQQGNLTRSFKLSARDTPVWLNIFRDNLPVEQAIIKLTETLDIIPSNLNNSRLDLELTQAAINLKDMIRDTLSGVRKNYDLVIFDCPPAINKISLSATCASDTVIIPINPEPYAMDGLDFTLAELERIKQDFKLDFNYKIVWNRYDARERLGAVYMHDLAKDENKIKNILPVVIRVDASLKNSIFDAVSLFDKSKKSNIREDIDQFTKEILGINQWVEQHNMYQLPQDKIAKEN